MIVTNLRIPEDEWLQIRAAAAELGMSANEYINQLIQKTAIKNELAENRPGKKHPIWDLPKAYVKGKGMGMSEDDEIIYG